MKPARTHAAPNDPAPAGDALAEYGLDSQKQDSQPAPVVLSRRAFLGAAIGLAMTGCGSRKQANEGRRWEDRSTASVTSSTSSRPRSNRSTRRFESTGLLAAYTSLRAIPGPAGRLEQMPTQ